jgi:Phosphotransferase enzyme family
MSEVLPISLDAPVDAWRHLWPASPTPCVTLVRPKRWSPAAPMYVFRLAGVGRHHGDVAAVLGKRDRAEFEWWMYSAVLPALDMPSVHGYGLVPHDRQPDRAWLFLEYAEPRALSLADARHREPLGAWLGRLHAEGSRIVDGMALPDRGAAFHHEHLLHAVDDIRRCRAEAALTMADHGLLTRVEHTLLALQTHWNTITRECGSMPVSLLHGDLKEKNVGVRASPTGLATLVFDWEFAGVGPIGVDIGTSGVHHSAGDAYLREARRIWPAIDASDLERFGTVGEILRAILAIRWAMDSFDHGGHAKALAHFAHFVSRIETAAESLRW